ncbi:putative oxygenase MesX [Brachybacterium saurashtrense]|uniref:DUF1852 family protein n=1 Tax=Brachybacterium saurashtrense TaxID=556288 RepID=A0A345YT79_9MICO|nr:putative oxygenase MesX [Brachybacterium saurashtrense]AXK47131.1 DUF1852 family protein [Brachybacterium saurashtrense]RRR23453.1 DUF1852 family protein [Brachybacterium saurashtrense]
MTTDFTFSLRTTRFDEDYVPDSGSRITTNFANLARGDDRRENLRRALTMISARANELAGTEDRYAVELDIVSAELHPSADEGEEPAADDAGIPLIEMLDVQILDRATGARLPGITGNNFSSYVRDHDFSVRLPAHQPATDSGAGASGPGPVVPEDFGALHGRLFRRFLASDVYREHFARPPVVCISVSTSRVYRRIGAPHPVLGVEYATDGSSLTDRYFGEMGLQVRCFMPRGAAAPLAFYFEGDLLADHTDLALIGTIATMETFQRIYRPEIYSAREPAGEVYRPRLDNPDHADTGIEYDREERSRLGAAQGRYIEERLLVPHGERLEQWLAEEVAR